MKATTYKITKAESNPLIGLAVGVYNLSRKADPFKTEPTKYSDKVFNNRAKLNVEKILIKHHQDGNKEEDFKRMHASTSRTQKIINK